MRDRRTHDPAAGSDAMRDRAAELAAAADGRPPSRARPDSRSARRAERTARLRWLSVAVAGAMLFVVLIRGVIEKSKWTAGSAGLPPVSADVDVGDASEREPSIRVIGRPASSAPCDAAGPAGIAGCTGIKPGGSMSEAERREARRRADEAIKVIEATTPET